MTAGPRSASRPRAAPRYPDAVTAQLRVAALAGDGDMVRRLRRALSALLRSAVDP